MRAVTLGFKSPRRHRKLIRIGSPRSDGLGTLTLAPVDGTTLIDGATHRVPQQLFTVNEDGTFGGTSPEIL